MSASSLARLQEDFQNFVLSGDPAIEPHIAGNRHVYRTGYRVRLREALEANFPALYKLLGPADFATLAHFYIDTHDSPFYSVQSYGDELSDMLALHPAYEEAPVLAELARWEWVMSQVSDAADESPVEYSALTRVEPEDWAELSFELHPSMRRLNLTWNAPQIWKAALDDVPPPRAAFTATPLRWLLWRHDLRFFFRSLDAIEAAMLDAALEGRCFGEFCMGLATYVGEEAAPAQAASYLRTWVDTGLVVALR